MSYQKLNPEIEVHFSNIMHCFETATSEKWNYKTVSGKGILQQKTIDRAKSGKGANSKQKSKQNQQQKQQLIQVKNSETSGSKPHIREQKTE